MTLTSCYTITYTKVQTDSGDYRQILAPAGIYISSYTTAEMTLNYVKLVLNANAQPVTANHFIGN